MKIKKNGFSLIELLVVLFIIGALTGLLLPNFMGARERARDSQRKQDLLAIKNALRLYYNDNQGYPDIDVFSFGEEWDGYMTLVPDDPLEPEETYYYCTDSSGNFEQFLLAAKLENIADSDALASQDYCTTTCNVGDECEEDNCYFVCAH